MQMNYVPWNVIDYCPADRLTLYLLEGLFHYPLLLTYFSFFEFSFELVDSDTSS